MSTLAFALTWDYRCPFAWKAHDHVVTALQGGADWDVTFLPFSLGQVHVAVVGAGVNHRADLPQSVASYDSTTTIETIPVQRVTAPMELTLQMVAEGRAWFGERFRVTVVPR